VLKLTDGIGWTQYEMFEAELGEAGKRLRCSVERFPQVQEHIFVPLRFQFRAPNCLLKIAFTGLQSQEFTGL
jgi:hypothetical protein